jgi:hypothetical protein
LRPAGANRSQDLISKITRTKQIGDMEAVEQKPCKHKVLSSNPSAAKRKEKVSSLFRFPFFCVFKVLFLNQDTIQDPNYICLLLLYYWSLNTGLCAYWAGTLPLEAHPSLPVTFNCQISDFFWLRQFFRLSLFLLILPLWFVCLGWNPRPCALALYQ